MTSHQNNWPHSKIILVSAAAGLVVLLLLLFWLGFAFWSSFLWGLIVGIIVYIILTLNFAGAADEDHGAYGAHGGAAGASAGSGAAHGSAGGAAAASAEPAADTAETAAAVADDTADAGDETSDATDDTAAQPAAAATGVASGGAVVKPSKSLPGQDELAARKGEWKYKGGAGGGAAKPASSAAAPGEAGGEDYDGDGIHEGTDEGTKPEMLSEARAGGADNLKEIKGVGPAMEKLLNSLGVYHFDQVAGWNADEVAWVDANLKGFKGRVSRDNWVEQAKILAAGGETEFSRKVDKGGVY
ncbi:MAG: endonuclease [Rhodobacter sp.]|nr:endonuclease [Rhodobacter sp.]